MSMTFESAGSVRFQIGCSLSAIRDCISAGDVERLSDQVAYLVVLASPYILKDGSKVSLDELEVKDVWKEDPDPEHALFKECRRVMLVLLPLLAKEGLYAFVRSGLQSADELAEEMIA